MFLCFKILWLNLKNESKRIENDCKQKIKMNRAGCRLGHADAIPEQFHARQE